MLSSLLLPISCWKENDQRYFSGSFTEPKPPPSVSSSSWPTVAPLQSIYLAFNENDGQGLLFKTGGDVLAASFGQDFGDFSTLRYIRDDDYTTAMTISFVLQQHMLCVISELPKKQRPDFCPPDQGYILLQTFWDNLPDEFEAKDFKEIAGSIGFTILPPSATSALGREQGWRR